MQHLSAEDCLFSSEKTCDLRVLEVNKKKVPPESHSLNIQTDSVNQILKNKEKVIYTHNINILTTS